MRNTDTHKKEKRSLVHQTEKPTRNARPATSLALTGREQGGWGYEGNVRKTRPRAESRPPPACQPVSCGCGTREKKQNKEDQGQIGRITTSRNKGKKKKKAWAQTARLGGLVGKLVTGPPQPLWVEMARKQHSFPESASNATVSPPLRGVGPRPRGAREA